jgi:hypothetical protein
MILTHVLFLEGSRVFVVEESDRDKEGLATLMRDAGITKITQIALVITTASKKRKHPVGDASARKRIHVS